MKRLLILIYLSIFSFAMQAQNQVQVSGSVKDAENNEELPGVSIIVVGTTNGVTTDITGNFSITVAQNSTIKLSYIGYITQEIKISDTKVLDIKLVAESKSIDEVVVVGYSVQKKRDVLGAISKVSSKELTKVTVPSAQQALQGRIAGVQVAAQTGAPGAPISVRIRGVGSICSGNEPLYIVDNIPVEGALNNLSPNDIEDMTILKDASSSAIYGSRANNGVVLITTKAGKKGEAKVNYNTQLGFQMHGALTEMAGTDDYIKLYNEAATADNLGNTVSQRTLIEGAYIKNFANENHIENIFQIAPIQSHEITFSGGNEKTQYLISASYFNQEGIIKNTNYERYNLRSNIDSEIRKWWKLKLNISGSFSSNRLVSSSGDGFEGEGGSVVRYALYRSPAIPIYDSKESFVDKPSTYFGNNAYDGFFGDGYSPEGLCENTDRTKKSKSFLVSASSVINFPLDIFNKTTVGVEYNFNEKRVYDKKWGDGNRINATNGLNIENASNVNYTFNSTLNHSITLFKKHNINSLIGTEAIQNNDYSLSASNNGFINTDDNFIYIGKGTPPDGKHDASQGESGAALLSFFGTINYNYMQKYYLSGIVRRDGSSRFIEEYKWGTFYSVSGGWNIETEEFMKNFDYINKLKLRIGYGEIGNQNIGLYAYSSRYSSNFYYTFGGKTYNGYSQTTMGNKDLKWETSKQFNVGLDFQFFKGNLGVTIDYYYKINEDMLVKAPLPLSVGLSEKPWINSGNVLNTGIDLEIFYRKDYKDWGFNITLNGGYLYNEVIDIDAPIPGGRIDTGVNATYTEKGYPIGSFYLYEMDGIFQNKNEILTSAFQEFNIKPGDVKYVDNFEDNKIDEKDRKHVGSSIPTFTTGLNMSAYYQDFDISLFFQGAFGQDIYSQVNMDIEGFYRGFNVTQRYIDEHWTGEGSSNTQPRASWSGKSNNVIGSTRFLEDASYVRLKNIQIGYNFPYAKKLFLEKVRFYVSATNLLTFTNYSGLDPEMTVSTNSAKEGDTANGIDWGTYPVAKTFTFGMNVTF